MATRLNKDKVKKTDLLSYFFLTNKNHRKIRGKLNARTYECGEKNEYNKATEYFQKAKILGATGSEIDIFIGNTLSKIENWNTEKYAEYFMQRIDNYINEDGMNEGAVDIYNNIIEYFEKPLKWFRYI